MLAVGIFIFLLLIESEALLYPVAYSGIKTALREYADPLNGSRAAHKLALLRFI